MTVYSCLVVRTVRGFTFSWIAQGLYFENKALCTVAI